LIEGNNPVDIGKEQIRPHQKPIEDMLVAYDYKGAKRSLAELMSKVDKEEPYIMSNLERAMYLAVRESLQVFKVVADLVGKKVGLAERLVQVPIESIGTDARLLNLQDFTHAFASYAASKFAAKKIEEALVADGITGVKGENDVSKLELQCRGVDMQVMRRLVAPIYGILVDNLTAKEEDFSSPAEFALYIKQLYERYAELALQRKSAHPDLLPEVEKYQWRIMDDFLVLVGFEDKTIAKATVIQQKPVFQSITEQEIAGNRLAKLKTRRFVERLALYDPKKQMNPIMDLGGLAWTMLFDGPPGTGKSSIFRLAMTILDQRASQVGQPYHVFTIDQSIKDEYYGKTGKILLAKLAPANDPALLAMGIFDDIDLLTSTRDDAQGADNDINNIIMQFLDGVYTVRRGNVINFAASNKPTGVDEALRNRFNERLLIDGPVSAEDFADIAHIKLGKQIKYGLVKVPAGYTPFATQNERAKDGSWISNAASFISEKFSRPTGQTLLDFGHFMVELKKQNPLITGRSANAILEAVRDRSADFEIPGEWFEKRELFVDQPYERKLSMLKGLYRTITLDDLLEEAQRHAESEQRYSTKEADDQVTKGYNARVWDLQAEIKFHEEMLRREGNGDRTATLSHLQSLRQQLLDRTKAGDR